jgi:DNA primase
MTTEGTKKGKLPHDLLQKIRDSVNIVEVVGEHVVLRKSGANHSGLCPFHSERSPSFSVSENKQLYHCYGCKRGGDLFSFVMEIFGISFPEAVEELAERGRVVIPKEHSRDGAGGEDPEVQARRAAAREKTATASKLNRFVAAFYHQQLQSNATAREYFTRRGITPELVRNFYLGAANASWDSLANHLIEKKAPMPLALELGLVRPSPKRADGFFDLFRDRVMFPILDLRGKVAGFGGRLLSASDDGPKYMNSPESLLFQKSKLAFGLFQAQKHVREKDEIILVEGYFDVLVLHAFGFENVVATCGTSLTADHLQVFRRFASKVTILFDSDRAGISATERGMELGLDHGAILYGAELPPGQDPDEVLLQEGGKERMQQILAAASPILDRHIDRAIEEAEKGPEARAQSLKLIGAWLKRFKDPIGRDVRVESVVSRMKVSRELLLKAMGETVAPMQSQARPSAPSRAQSGPLVRPRTPIKPGAPAKQKISTSERTLLQALVRGAEARGVLDEIGATLPPGSSILDLFAESPIKVMATEVLKAWEEQGDLRGFRPELENAEVQSIVVEAMVASEPGFTPAQLRFAADRAVAKAWARFSQRIRSELTAAEAKQDAELQAKLMKEYLDVQRRMKEFTNFYDEA